MTLNQIKLTSHIIDKFTSQIKPMSCLSIESKDVFSDRKIMLTDHALKRLNERLNINKEKVEYAQFIRSQIYGTPKIFVTHKTESYFVSNIAFGQVDMTLVFTKSEEHYILVTAYINSTDRFIEFMKREYNKEQKEQSVDSILKDSLFNGKSSEEFFAEFDKKNNLCVCDHEEKQVKKPVRRKQVVTSPSKSIHSQELNDEYMNQLLASEGLSEPALVETQPKEVKRTNLRPSKPKPINSQTKLHSQAYDDSYADQLLNVETLVQQSAEDIIEVEQVVSAPIIRENDRETKIPEQKPVHSQELNEDFMNELLGDFNN